MCRIKVLLMEEESYFGHLGLLGGGWEEESRGGSVCVCVCEWWRARWKEERD